MPDNTVNIAPLLAGQFGGEVKRQDEQTMKVHVSQLATDDILHLSSLAKQYACHILLKRSGTGITIVVTNPKQS